MKTNEQRLKTGIEGLRKFINGHSVAMIGIGVSNAPLISLFHSLGATRITARDKKDISETALKYNFSDMGVEIISGEEYLSRLDEDIIIRTPGIRPDKEEFENARKNGSLVCGETELFIKYCPCPIFAITGSAGKTTTTTLVSKILEEDGKNVFLGGNIGRPLLPLIGEIKESDVAVCELSSFQLMDFDVSPDICIATNISENHLDWHTDMNEYIEAKKNIFKFQNETSLCVINACDPVVKEFSCDIPGRVRYFSSEGNNFDGDGIFLENDIFFKKENGNITKLFSRSDLLLPGKHNAENLMAAMCAVYDAASEESAHVVASSFKGVEHRMELCGEVNGIAFYNSSIDTSPARTTAALNSFDKRIVLICGGYDKNLSYESLGKLICEKVKVCVMCGQTSGKINSAILNAENFEENKDKLRLFGAVTFEEAVKTAYENAKEGDKVVLSPASASFDMFKNFEERAHVFKKIVSDIITSASDENK